MYFTSLGFLFFLFPISILLHAAVPQQWQDRTLLLLSLLVLFGGGLPRMLLFSGMMLGCYGAGRLLERFRRKSRISALLLLLLFLLHVALLVLIRPFGQGKLSLSVSAWIEPIGISFLVLQGFGYCMDVFRGKLSAERRLDAFASYYLFYPKLLMGPVLSYADWQHAVLEKRCDAVRIGEGLRQVVLGAGIKVFLADGAGFLYETVQQSSVQASALAMWLSLFSFAVRFWLEGTAYSRMACGLSKCYGFCLPENYGPFSLTQLVTGCVRNWNRTVVQWFQKNMRLPVRTNCFHGILLQTLWIWLWIGAWCGNGGNFLLFGAWMGLCLTLEQTFASRMQNWYPAIRQIWTIFWLLGGVILLQADGVSGLLTDLPVLLGGGTLVREQDQYLLLNGGVELAVILAVLIPWAKWTAYSASRGLKARTGSKILEPILLLLLLFFLAAALLCRQSEPLLFAW